MPVHGFLQLIENQQTDRLSVFLPKNIWAKKMLAFNDLCKNIWTIFADCLFVPKPRPTFAAAFEKASFFRFNISTFNST